MYTKLIIFVPVFLTTVAEADALSTAEREYWAAVRHTERFLSQDIIASEPFEDGSRVIVLLEPSQAAFQSRDIWLREIFGGQKR